MKSKMVVRQIRLRQKLYLFSYFSTLWRLLLKRKKANSDSAPTRFTLPPSYVSGIFCDIYGNASVNQSLTRTDAMKAGQETYQKSHVVYSSIILF